MLPSQIAAQPADFFVSGDSHLSIFRDFPGLKVLVSIEDPVVTLARRSCSGYDVTPNTDRGTPPEGWVNSKHFDSWTDQFARSCLRDWLVMWDLLKPVVVKVQGFCLAGGTEILSMADMGWVAKSFPADELDAAVEAVTTLERVGEMQTFVW